MRIAIYGAGSLGTILGAFISKAGVPIELINRNKAHVAVTVTPVSLSPSIIALCIGAAPRYFGRRETCRFIHPYFG